MNVRPDAMAPPSTHALDSWPSSSRAVWPWAPSETTWPDPHPCRSQRGQAGKLAEAAGIDKVTHRPRRYRRSSGDAQYQVYFDAQTTGRRAEGVRKAVEARKHVYCEKPTAVDTKTALELYQLCTKAGLKNGVVQDKLWLPGLVKLRRLKEKGFFGKIFSVRGEFGYWVFEGDTIPAQRPSWNYRKEDDGGLIVDMLCHWRYVLDNVLAAGQGGELPGRHPHPRARRRAGQEVQVHRRRRRLRHLRARGRSSAHFNSSWATRVRRDDLLTVQVDGTHGSAVAGLRDCWIQHYGNTPRPPGTRTCRSRSTSSTAGQAARAGELRQRLQGAVGAVPAPHRQGRAVPLEPERGRQGRAAGGAGPGELGQARLGHVPDLG
jgi:predicted dehydrogenase